MTTWLVVLLAYIGFSSLARAMERHAPGGTSGPLLNRARRWRCGGALSLLASLLLCCHGNGLGLGLVTWLGALTLALLLVAFGLSYWPRWLLLGRLCGQGVLRTRHRLR